MQLDKTVLQAAIAMTLPGVIFRVAESGLLQYPEKGIAHSFTALSQPTGEVLHFMSY